MSRGFADRPPERSGNVWPAGCLLMLALVITGCPSQELAPPADYSPVEVEAMRDEMGRMEWE